jgi:hypothetical protein
MRTRHCQSWVTVVLLAVCHQAAAVDDWPGWRGLDKEGRCDSSAAPLTWSPQENVVWRTRIPGEGHSSPIIVGDHVYISTAYLSDRQPILLHALVYLKLALLLVVTAIASWILCRFAVSWTGGWSKASGFPSAVVLASLAVLLGGLILFGDNALDFARCSIRAWIGSGFVVALALALSGVGAWDSRRMRQILIWGTAAFAGVLLLCVPARDHAYRGGLFANPTLVMLAVATICLLVATSPY